MARHRHSTGALRVLGFFSHRNFLFGCFVLLASTFEFLFPHHTHAATLVQRNSEDMGSNTSVQVSLGTNVDTSHAFITTYLGVGSSTTSSPDDFQIEAYFDTEGSSVDHFTLARYGNTTGITVYWQVIEMDTIDVTHDNNISFGTGDSSQGESISISGTNKAFAIVTGRVNSATGSVAPQGMFSANITSTSNCTVERGVTGTVGQASLQIVEFTDSTTVEHQSVTASSSTNNTSISTIDTSVAFVVYSVRADTDALSTYPQIYLSGSTTLAVNRANTENNAYVEAYIVNMPGASTEIDTGADLDAGTNPVTISTVTDTSTAFTIFSMGNSGAGVTWRHQRADAYMTSTTNVDIYKVSSNNTTPYAVQTVQLPTSGSTISISGSADGSNGATVKVAVNGSIQGQTGTISSGSWTISNVAEPTSGDVVTVWIDSVSDSAEAIGITKYAGSDITGMVLNALTLSLGSSDNQTLSNANISQYDNSVSSNEDIFYDVDGNDDLAVCSASGSTGCILSVLSGNTYRPDSGSSGNITATNLSNAGTLTVDGNTIYVSGSLTSSGTFNANTSTVEFNGTGSQIIPALDYYNLTGSGFASGSITKIQSNSNSGTTVTLNGVTAGNLVVIYLKWEEGTVADASVSDGTSTLSKSTRYQDGTGQPFGQWFYLTSANGGDETYTATLPSGSSYIRMIAWEFNSPNGFAYDSENGAGQVSLTPSSGNITTFDGNTVVLGGYSEYSTASRSNHSINSLSATEVVTESYTDSWYRLFSSTFTGDAQLTMGSSGNSVVSIISFKELPSGSGSRTLASSGTIGVAGTFTPGSGTYTVTGSTMDFNGTSAQTIPEFDYNNLTLSGAHTTNSVTLASSGTIGVAGTFSPTATFTSGAYVITDSTVSFNGSSSQTIPAFDYYNLIGSSNSGSPAYIQDAKSSDPSASYGTSVAATYSTQNLTTGSVLWAYATWGTSDETPTCSDNVNSSWQTGPKYWDNTNHQGIAFFYFVNTAGGSKPTVTVSFSNNDQYRGLHIFEIGPAETSGQPAGIAPAINIQNNPSGTDSVVSNTIDTTGNNNALIVGATVDDTGNIGSFTAGTSPLAFSGHSGWTSSAVSMGEEAVLATGGTTSISFTPNVGTGRTMTGVMAFKGTQSASGARTLASSGTIGVAGTFTPGDSSYTVTGSTVNFNGSSTQTVNADFTYNNLQVQPSTNSVTTNFATGTATIGGDLTIGNGTNTSVVVSANNASTTLTVAGSVSISARL